MNSSCFDGVRREPTGIQGGTKLRESPVTHKQHWDICPPLRKCTGRGEFDFTGRTFGRMTVIGLIHGDYIPIHKEGKWVCRCVCGMFEIRKAKSIKNPFNNADRCEQCWRLALARREHEIQLTGRRFAKQAF